MVSKSLPNTHHQLLVLVEFVDLLNFFPNYDIDIKRLNLIFDISFNDNTFFNVESADGNGHSNCKPDA
ncbi:hypothetical protein N431DRAFT_439814 [Stipitochalara longipes BDJ]|nr:hypothetical protein N431DRAFT_439814 [Stipitochalara longipes BDJ]